jgi:hypothetical protein
MGKKTSGGSQLAGLAWFTSDGAHTLWQQRLPKP